MSIRDEIKRRVNEVTASHDLGSDYKGFAYWYLEEIEDFSQEEAEQLVTDGPWDGGRDAVHYDEDEKRLTIYQFKYTDNPTYAMDAFTDIQNAVQHEASRLDACRELRLVVVTTASADELVEARKNAQTRIRRWLTNQGYGDVEATVELVDLNYFKQAYERLYGVALTLEFSRKPLRVEQGYIGLVNAASFRSHVGDEALFGFNIRKFLGLRKGSVNWQMKQTLEDDEGRGDFWTYNNGIVCLATEIRAVSEDERLLDVDNFTIVNGAQTVNTIARFLDQNPSVTEPIWVLCKLIEVRENDLDRARMITRRSNTQTPTSNKDLRAVEAVHRQLETWLKRDFRLAYIYRRGGRAARGEAAIKMKEILQAYVAYWREKPEWAFAKVGQLFASDEEYSAAFPSEEVVELKKRGTDEEQRAFLVKRVLPWRLLEGIRTCIAKKVAGGLDVQWKSSAYHVLWLYRRLFELENIDDPELLLENVDEILDKTADDLIEGLVSYCVSNRDYTANLARALKTDRLRSEILSSMFFEQMPQVVQARRALRNVLGL